MKCSKREKFLMTFVSAIIFSICGSSLMGIGNFNVYIASYIHLVDKKINIQYGNFMGPLTVFCMAIFTPVGGILENLLNSRGALLFGAIVMELSAIAFYFQQNIIFFYALILTMGLGYGTSMAINTKNCCFYYPDHKGVIASSILSIGILSGAGFTMMGEKIINPEQKTLEEGEDFFKKEISERIRYYFLVMMICIPVGGLISLIFFQKYHKSFDKNLNDDDKKEINNSRKSTENKRIESNFESEELIETDNNNDDNYNDKDNNENNDKQDGEDRFMSVVAMSSYNKNLKEALKSLRFWKIVMLASFPILMVGFTSSIFRTYATLIKVEGKIMSFLPALLYILMGVSGLIWAFLVDKFKFRIVILLYCLIGLVEAVLMYFYLDNSTIFIVCSIISSLLASSLLSLINQHIMQLYGIHFQLFLGGIAQVFNGITTLVAALISVVLSVYYSSIKELQKPYKIVALISLPFIIIPGIFGVLESDIPFVYSVENEFDQSLMKQGTNDESVARDESRIDNTEDILIASLPGSLRNQIRII